MRDVFKSGLVWPCNQRNIMSGIRVLSSSSRAGFEVADLSARLIQHHPSRQHQMGEHVCPRRIHQIFQYILKHAPGFHPRRKEASSASKHLRAVHVAQYKLPVSFGRGYLTIPLHFNFECITMLTVTSYLPHSDWSFFNLTSTTSTREHHSQKISFIKTFRCRWENSRDVHIISDNFYFRWSVHITFETAEPVLDWWHLKSLLTLT